MNRILVVIILYNLDLKDSIAYNSLKKECDIFIYNNSVKTIDCSFDNNIKGYKHDPENAGLSKAYNYASVFAKENGYEWILIADQDTRFPKKVLSIYNSAIHENPTIRLFIPKVKMNEHKYMSPVLMHHYITKPCESCIHGIINPQNYGIINSGMLINVEAFWSVGGYNEKVWLDFADFQFIERFSKKYDKAYIVDAECMQSFSDEVQSIEQKIIRYKLFCSSLKFYKPNKSYDKFWLGIVGLKRAVSLCIQSKRLSPLFIFIRNYLL